ncbi:hypothetical protein DCC62_32335, partial [candidate division KSB1 bacterium]
MENLKGFEENKYQNCFLRGFDFYWPKHFWNPIAVCQCKKSPQTSPTNEANFQRMTAANGLYFIHSLTDFIWRNLCLFAQ